MYGAHQHLKESSKCARQHNLSYCHVLLYGNTPGLPRVVDAQLGVTLPTITEHNKYSLRSKNIIDNIFALHPPRAAAWWLTPSWA